MQGYRPTHVPEELIEQIAVVVEAKAFLHVVSRLGDVVHPALAVMPGATDVCACAQARSRHTSTIIHTAHLLQVRAAELGMSSRQVVQTYAKEAATLLLAEVERYTLPVEVPAGVSHSGNSVDMQQLSLNEFSGGLRSIQTAPSHQSRPSRPHDAAWGWLVPGGCMLSARHAGWLMYSALCCSCRVR